MFSENQLLYAPMSSICSNEIVWGAGFLSVCIVAVYLQKTKHPHRASLVIAIMAMALSMLFFLGDATRPAPALFLLTTIFNLIQWREPHWNHSQS